MERKISCFCCRGTGSAECKDTMYLRENGEWGFYSLADGVSSAKKSTLGAKAVQKALADAFEEKSEKFLRLPLDELKAELIAIVRHIFYNLCKDGDEKEDYASTLMVVIFSAKSGKYRWFHIGDGLIAVEGTNGEIEIESHPHNGITPQFTFTTADECLERRLWLGEGDLSEVQRILLFTDGAIMPFYRKQQLTVNGQDFLQKGSDVFYRILQHLEPLDDYSMLEIKIKAKG